MNEETKRNQRTLVGRVPGNLPRPHDTQESPARWIFDRLASYIQQFAVRKQHKQAS